MEVQDLPAAVLTALSDWIARRRASGDSFRSLS
jgi:hypothetical protein